MDILKNYISLSENALETIDNALENLLKKTKAKCVFLFEQSGYVISFKGNFPYLPAEDMGAVSAGTLEALKVMLNMVNAENVTIKLHSSEIENIHFLKISSKISAGIFFDSKIDEEKILEASKEFSAEINKTLSFTEEKTKLPSSSKFIEKKLNELFSDK